MNRLKLLFCVFGAAIFICVPASGTDAINYNTWVTTYYKDPHPEQMVDVIKEYQRRGMLRNEHSKMVCAAMFGSIMSQNPQNIEEWFSELDDVRQADKGFINYILWYSSTAVGRELLKKNTDAEEYTIWFSTPPQAVYSIDPGAKDVLDMNWAYFFVTGDVKAIINITSAFKYASYEKDCKYFAFSHRTDEDKRRAFLGSISLAAKWSLVSNGKQHKEVRDIIQAQADQSSGEQKEMLDAVLYDIDSNPYAK